MISVSIGESRFNYRAAGVCVHDGHVLLHRAANEDFWSLPGGRVEIGETAQAAVAREFLEELGPTFEMRVDRLLWVVENFFTYDGITFHEVGMYALLVPDTANVYLDKTRTYSGIEGDFDPLHRPIKLVFQWFPLATLETVPLFPRILRTALQHLPDRLEHIVNVDTPDQSAAP